MKRALSILLVILTLLSTLAVMPASSSAANNPQDYVGMWFSDLDYGADYVNIVSVSGNTLKFTYFFYRLAGCDTPITATISGDTATFDCDVDEDGEGYIQRYRGYLRLESNQIVLMIYEGGGGSNYIANEEHVFVGGVNRQIPYKGNSVETAQLATLFYQGNCICYPSWLYGKYDNDYDSDEFATYIYYDGINSIADLKNYYLNFCTEDFLKTTDACSYFGLYTNGSEFVTYDSTKGCFVDNWGGSQKIVPEYRYSKIEYEDDYNIVAKIASDDGVTAYLYLVIQDDGNGGKKVLINNLQNSFNKSYLVSAPTPETTTPEPTISDSSEKTEIKYKYGVENNRSYELTIKTITADLFANNAYTFNKDLAYITLSICNSTSETEKTIQKLYKNLGLKNYESNYYDKNQYYSPAEAFGSTEIITADGQKKYVIVMNIRGSTTKEDWISDAMTLFNKEIGDGFLSMGQAAFVHLYNFVNSLDDDLNKDNTIFVITGHSLGGAVANQVARLLGRYSWAKKENTYVYTYACPKNDIEGDNPNDYQNVFNFVNKNDIVPNFMYKVKTTKRQASRVGQDILFDSSTKELIKYEKKLYGFYWEDIMEKPKVHGPKSAAKYTKNIIYYNHINPTYLAALESDNYTKIHSTSISPYQYDSYAIHCPVDIKLYNSDSELIAYTQGGEAYTYANCDALVWVDGESKYVYALGENEYYIEFVGTDSGTMEFAQTTYDQNGNEISVVSYPNIPVDTSTDLAIKKASNATAENTLIPSNIETVMEHAWGEGVVSDDYNCTAGATITYTCSLCSDTKTESTDPTDHIDENEDGICDVCEKSMDDVATPSSTNTTAIIIVICAASAIVIAVMVIVAVMLVKNNKKKQAMQNQNFGGPNDFGGGPNDPFNSNDWGNNNSAFF